MKHPERIRHQGSVYRLAEQRTAASHYHDSHMKGEGVLFYVYALLTSKTGRNLPGVKEGVTKQRTSIPRELKSDMTPEQKVSAKEAAKAGTLWYTKIDGKGWRWGSRDGAKGVAGIQTCLEFLTRFKNKKMVDDVECLYCEVTNKIVGR